MLLQSSLLAVAVLAGLSTLILLLSRFEKPCSGNYRTRDEIARLLSEAEMPELAESSGLHALAGAFCCVAAGAHSKTVAEQQQIAATLYDLCTSHFEHVRMDEAVKVMVEGIIATAQKTKK
jgi:hypothetical protein